MSKYPALWVRSLVFKRRFVKSFAQFSSSMCSYHVPHLYSPYNPSSYIIYKPIESPWHWTNWHLLLSSNPALGWPCGANAHGTLCKKAADGLGRKYSAPRLPIDDLGSHSQKVPPEKWPPDWFCEMASVSYGSWSVAGSLRFPFSPIYKSFGSIPHAVRLGSSQKWPIKIEVTRDFWAKW